VFIDGTTEMPVFDTLEELEKQAPKPSHRRSVVPPPRPTRAAPKLERTGSNLSAVVIVPEAEAALTAAALEALPAVPAETADLTANLAPESDQLEDVTPILPPRRITHVGSQ